MFMAVARIAARAVAGAGPTATGTAAALMATGQPAEALKAHHKKAQPDNASGEDEEEALSVVSKLGQLLGCKLFMQS